MGAKHLTIEEYASLKAATKYIPVDEIVKSGLTTRSASTLRSIKRSAHFADYERIVDRYVENRKGQSPVVPQKTALVIVDMALAAALMEFYQPLAVRRGPAGVQVDFPSQAFEQIDSYWTEQLRVEPKTFLNNYQTLQKRAKESY